MDASAFPWAHQGAEGLHAAGASQSNILQYRILLGARQIVGLGLMTWLSYSFVKTGRRADLGVAKEPWKKMGLKAPEHGNKELQNWEGDRAEIENAQIHDQHCPDHRNWLCHVSYSCRAVDLSMSLAPHFFANMFLLGTSCVDLVWFDLDCYFRNLTSVKHWELKI